MAQHYTQNTYQAEHFCNRCRKLTAWRVLNGKLAFCIYCYDHPKPQPPAKVTPLPEPTLF